MRENNKEESQMKSKGEWESWRAEEEHQAILNCWAVIYLRDARKDTSRRSRRIAPGYGGRGTSVIWWLSDRARWLYTAQPALRMAMLGLKSKKIPVLPSPAICFFSDPLLMFLCSHRVLARYRLYKRPANSFSRPQHWRVDLSPQEPRKQQNNSQV